MEITTEGMTTKKIPFINLMATIYFTNHQKMTARRLFKEVSMHYLRQKLP